MYEKWRFDIGNKLKNLQLFELGNSVVLYYLLIFYLRPVLVLLGLPNEFPLTPYHINYSAMGYITLGLIFFIIGYYNKISASCAAKIQNPFKKEWNVSRARSVFGILFLTGLGIKLFRVFNGMYVSGSEPSFFTHSSFVNSIGFLDWLGYIALVIAFISYFQLKKNNDAHYKLWRILAWGAFAVEIVYALPSCVRANVVIPIVLYFIVRFLLVKIDYKMIFFAGLGIALVLFPLGNLCRHPQIMGMYNTPPTIQDSALQEAAPSPQETLARAASFTIYFIAESFLSRIDQSNVITGIIEHPQPLLYGKPLLNFFVSLGPPRFLWENKPIITADGNAFGHVIGVLAPSNMNTFVGATVVGDWYINFGIGGIIIGMFFMGLLFRIIYDYCIVRTNVSSSGVLLYSIAWVQIMRGFEDSIAPVYAGLVKVMILLFMIVLVLQKDTDLWRRIHKRTIIGTRKL